MQTHEPKKGNKVVKSSYGRSLEIPDDWNFVRLDSFLEVNMGQSPPSEHYNTESNGLPFYQGVAEFGYTYPYPKIWCIDAGKIADINEILFSVRAPVGEINLTNTKCGIGRGIASLRPKCADLQYCYYLLKQFRSNFLKYSQGVTYDSINRDEINQTLFPYTGNIIEQQKIASILFKVDDLLKKTDQIVAQTLRLKKGLKQKLLKKGIEHQQFKNVHWYFGKDIEIPEAWELKKIGEVIIEHKQGYYTNETYNKFGKRLVRITDLFNPELSYETMPFLEIDERTFKQFKVELGDFLVARSGASIGRYGIAKKDIDCIFGSYIIRFKPNSRLLDVDFFGQLYEFPVVSQRLKGITQGAANPNINAENIKSIKIPLPPLDEQKRIASILISVDNSIKKQLSVKMNFYNLGRGLMQKLLTGKIRVKL